MLGLGNSMYHTGASFVGGLDPTQVSNLAVYLKRKEGVTAAKWNDSSGNLNHATQATVGDQATVSDGGLLFESADGDHYDFDNQIAIDSEQGFTIMVVIKNTTVSANMCLLGLNSTQHFLEFTNPSGTDKGDKLRIRLGSTTTTINPDGDDQFGTSRALFTVVREAGATGNLLVYKDGTELDQSSQAANPGDAEFISLGTRNGDRFLNALVYEFIFYQKAVSGTELVQLHETLVSKHLL
tara:strand:- start:1378 stop:2094 length:717 start_codon:yes stop_codon:yes gene_type:complete